LLHGELIIDNQFESGKDFMLTLYIYCNAIKDEISFTIRSC
jgi:hypothetical protein